MEVIMKVIYSVLNDENVLCKKVIKNIDSIDFCDDHILLFKIIKGVSTSVGFIYFSDVLSIENY